MVVREKDDIYSYATNQNLNNLLTNKATFPLVETTMVDLNHDDKAELFLGKITFPSKAADV